MTRLPKGEMTCCLPGENKRRKPRKTDVNNPGPACHIYTYKRVVCVCLLVCLSAFYRPHEISYFAALPPSPRAGAVGRPRASGQACTARARARMPYNSLLNEKIVALMPFTNKTVRGRACCRIRNCRDFQKKGKKKINMPLPKFSLQFAFSWSVYFSNRTESYSSQIEFAGPHGIRESQATYLHCGGEARAKKRARPPATCRKASTGKTGADTGPEGCGSPAVFPSPCLDLQRLQS